MGFFKNPFKNENVKSQSAVTKYELVTKWNSSYTGWCGNLYSSDIIRSCLEPIVTACGKLNPKHIRETVTDTGKIIEVNPFVYLRFMLSEPNSHMCMQKMIEKVVADRIISGNGFILIIRDENGIPTELYPISAVSAEAIYDSLGVLYLKFVLRNGKTYTFPYTDIIHLRRDYSSNDIFGTPISEALENLMDVVTTIDQGTVKAIKNSNAIRWLLEYSTVMDNEDIKRKAKEFTENFLSIDNETSVAASDAGTKATQVTPTDFVPNAAQQDKNLQRIYALFGVNEKIIKASYNEVEWNAFYESVIEPIALELSSEFTRKLFTRKERGFGNKIVFEASDLACTAIQTKLAFKDMVDRGAMTPNEWRSTFNFAPLEGGDEALLRKDTGRLVE